MSELLFFGTSNTKLRRQQTATFSIPAGYTCPGACECLAKFDIDKRKLVDGKNQKFRCYSASMAAARTTVRRSEHNNWKKLQDASSEMLMAELINDSLPGNYWHRIRIHAGGDFYNATYFRAWCRVAAQNPARLFYAYTKSLPIWVANKGRVPDNMVLKASVGGKWDALIAPNHLPYAVVVYHPDQAEAMGLEIDHDDSHARDPECKAFSLLIHGQQPSGSEAAAAIKRLKREGIKYSYGRAS